jgi:pyridoxal phosphate enzyme (YggS family)
MSIDTSSTSPFVAVEELKERLSLVRRRIATAGGDPAAVRIVAVTKGFGLPAVRAALGAGIVHLGENYADELVDKALALQASPVIGPDGEIVAPIWHFLGAIQRNKIARLSPYVSWYEGVDRLVEAKAIASRAPDATVLVEVNATGAPDRAGLDPTEVPSFVAELNAAKISVRGLMTVAPVGGGERAKQAFETVAHLASQLGLLECSMGMSDDLELAVAAGATSIRVGRALFGARLAPGQVPQ